MKRKLHNESPLSLFAFQDIITSVTGVFLLITLLMAVELTTRKAVDVPVVASEVIDQSADSIANAEIRLRQLRKKVNSRSSRDLRVTDFTESSATSELNAIQEHIRIITKSLEKMQEERHLLEQQESNAKALLKNRAKDYQRLDDLVATRTSLEIKIAELKNSKRVFYNPTDERGRKVILVELFDDMILVAEVGSSNPPRQFSATRLKSGLFNSSGELPFLDWAKQHSTADVRFIIIGHPGTVSCFSELKAEFRELGFSLGYDLLPNDKAAIEEPKG